MDTFGYTVKREPQDAKVEHERSMDTFGYTVKRVPQDVKVEHELQEPNNNEFGKPESNNNFKFEKGKRSKRKRKFYLLSGSTPESNNNLKKNGQDFKHKQQYSAVQLNKIRNSIERNIEKQLPGTGFKNFAATSILINPSHTDLPNLIQSRWKDFTPEEYVEREIWIRFNKFPMSRPLLLFEELDDDVKVFIPMQLEARKIYYNNIRKVVERQFKQGPKEDVLCAFAIYFRKSQEDVTYNFPDMTRQEVYDTCLLRYSAMPRQKQKEYEEKRTIEDGGICLHRFDMLGKKWSNLLQPGDVKVKHLSKEKIEAYLKQMPRTTKVEVVEREGGQFINVLDIKRCNESKLVKLINCRWKYLTEAKNFQDEVTRAFRGRVIPVKDINVAWKNLGNNLRVKNFKQTMFKVAIFTEAEYAMQCRLKEGVLYSFSSYYCEFEDVVKTEFPDMTKKEVYDTCLLRYVMAPREIRHIYKILSTRDECRKLCDSRFGETLRI
ncbi:hypothetical protein KY290_031011 [Solanum tuberosum]|uniref:Uncharacterized protein n=1 Tax=Solanum tuberosum TaxID=4113 RepID=A0ABQ7U971_SOLTU|nr:hypothetical protein KY290_031011 [Solanum tuberosum]